MVKEAHRRARMRASGPFIIVNRTVGWPDSVNDRPRLLQLGAEPCWHGTIDVMHRQGGTLLLMVRPANVANGFIFLISG
ncbi:MAG: hypothetical protein K0Q64_1212 [Nitrobacter vulgaris]|nr:hypothetical protein [Nitrobacter vulgaris]